MLYTQEQLNREVEKTKQAQQQLTKQAEERQQNSLSLYQSRINNLQALFLDLDRVQSDAAKALLRNDIQNILDTFFIAEKFVAQRYV
jgi:DNA-binding transcriptional regulator GbsR (MarR family)